MSIENPFPNNSPDKKSPNSNWLPEYMDSYRELTGEEFLTQMERHTSPFTGEDLQKAVEELDKKSEKNPKLKRILRMLSTYGLIYLAGATAGTVAGKAVRNFSTFKESLTPYEYYESGDNKEINEKDKLDSGLTKGTFVLPEVSIYGHRDEMTDAILNYMTGKSEISKDVLELITKHDLQIKLQYEEDFFVKDYGYKPSKLEQIKSEIESVPTDKLEEYMLSEKGEELLLSIYALEEIDWKKENVEDFFMSSPDIRAIKLLAAKKAKLEKNFLFTKIAMKEDTTGYNSDEFLYTMNKNEQMMLDRLGPEKYMKYTAKKYKEYFFSPVKMREMSGFDVSFYKSIWEMHQRHGNPKIDLHNETADRMYNRAYFNNSTNTMYLPKYEIYNDEKQGSTFFVQDWIAELSHSKQFTEKPHLSDWKSHLVSIRISREMERTGKSFWEVYDSIEYNKKGSIENEAHTVIEEKLKEELEMRRIDHGKENQ